MQSGISALERRIARQRLLGPVLEGTPEVLTEIFVWEPLERKIDAAASALRCATDGLRLAHFVTDGGTIDREAVEIFDEPFTRRDGTTGTRKGQRRRLLGRVYGAGMVSGVGMECFRNARVKLEMIGRRCDDPKKINDGGLAYLTSLRKEAIDLLGGGIRRFRAAAQFFTEPNIEEFSRWLAERHPKGLRAAWRVNNGRASILILRPDGKPAGSFQVPPLDRLPNEEGLIEPLRWRSDRIAAE